MKLSIIAAVAALAATTPVAAANLITNGNFETGTLSGWTLADSGSGSWFVIGNGAGTAINGFPTPTLAAGGSFVAMTDQSNPGSHNLSQTLTLGAGAFVLSFDARGSDRALRVSWHSEADLVVLSMWRDNVCSASFRLSIEEVPELVAMLRAGLDRAYRHAPTRELA